MTVIDAMKASSVKGYTLLELLVALIIFSAGLLIIIQMQFSAQRQQQEALYISRGAQQAFNLSALWTMFETSPGKARAEQLLQIWQIAQADTLPQGQGLLCAQGKKYAIVVLWRSAWQTAQSYCHFNLDDAQNCVQLSVYVP